MYQAIKDKDEGVFKCGKVKNTFGYEKIDEFFVDNSGFGSESEPALTARQFLSKVKKGLYYAITGVGQFQVYIGEFKKIGKKQALQSEGLKSRRKVGNNTYESFTVEGEKIITLHNTDILIFKNGNINLYMGGYDTMTTRARLNKYLPAGLNIRRINGDSYLIDNRTGADVKTEFTEGMQVKI